MNYFQETKFHVHIITLTQVALYITK